MIGAATLAPFAASAQRARTRTRFILWVSTESQPDPFIDGFREGMRERGYVEGRDLAFVLRYAPDPAALRARLDEILAIPADLIVASGTAIQALHATAGRPVLYVTSGDPVALGVADNLARPGLNFTGFTFMSRELTRARVELLREMLPELRAFAALSQAGHPGEASEHRATLDIADALALGIAYVPFRSAGELDGALERVRASGAGALLVYPDEITLTHRARIAAFARDMRLASMFGWREHCDAGGLASYGANQRATYVRLAAYADRILNGEKPAELPIEQPIAFELVLNLRTARELGAALPPIVLASADDVIQ